MATYLFNGPVVEVQNLVKQYPRVPFNAVDHVSFTLEEGEVLGLLGPNGAGKTTVVNILITRMPLTEGSVRIMGLDVKTDAVKLKKYIGVVPQQSNLDQSLRVREILTFHAAFHGIPRREREMRADKLLADLGLAQRAQEKIGYYSGGMGQRVMIARALMHNPRVLFLDEPTNRLDPQARLFLWNYIQTFKKRGLTILLTTHDLDEADQLCDRIAIMDHGHILMLDTATELKKVIPGTTRLELRVQLPAHVSTVEASGEADEASADAHALQDILATVLGVSKVEEMKVQQGQENVSMFRLYAQDAQKVFTQATPILEAHGARLLDFNVTRASLEDVFIHLTGRNLRV